MTRLARKHDSVQRNPIIADMFHRAGLIEKWGRGTNRVISMCREAGIALPEFEEIGGSALVTFRVPVKPESQPESLDQRVLGLLRQGPAAEVPADGGRNEAPTFRRVAGRQHPPLRTGGTSSPMGSPE